MRDVPIVTLDFLAGLLRRRRKTHDRRPFRRAAVARTQAKLVLGWFRDAARVAALGRDHKICRATARRSSHEGIDVLAAQATETGNHAWYSGKHKKFGGNIQVFAETCGFPIWTSPVEPGSTHDIIGAGEHCLGALYPAAATGLATLAEKGYQGAGIGVHTPIKGSKPGDRQPYLQQLAHQGPGPRRKRQRWTALRHVTVSPSRVGDITAAALVLTTIERGTR